MTKTLFLVLLIAASCQAQPKVFTVSNLNDGGAGSLRECASAVGDRRCDFAVTGRIKQTTPLRITNGNLFINGRSAPGEAPMVTGASISVEASDVTISHLQIRAGDAPVNQKSTDRDSLKILGTSSKPTARVRIENCSIGQGMDENFSTYGPVSDVQVINCIVSEAMRFSGHAEQGTKGHSMGALVGIGTRRILFQGNVFAHNNDRNIRWREDTSGVVLGNVFYNWGGATDGWNTNNVTNGKTLPPIQLDFISNTHIPGPGTKVPGYSFYAQNEELPNGSRFFLKDNFGPKRTSDSQDDWAISNIPLSFKSASRVTGPEFPTLAREPAMEAALTNAGAKPENRNAIDARILSEVRNRTGGFIDCVEFCAPKGPNGEDLTPMAGGFNPAPVATATATAAPTAVALPTETATPEPTPTRTPVATHTVAPTHTAYQTKTPTPKPTRTPTRTATATPTAEAGKAGYVTGIMKKYPKVVEMKPTTLRALIEAAYDAGADSR